ncbi:MAG: phospho-N-acetylmuramoyl-pentapeptide-transferase [Puniceicoccales bacterium]|jgi:phospho-N-acetylmuramoyl-pentapeptide-transferase|nr:phospho-N-acetylmuramoyl-pentapeptide-transferase [Puniceicoccales bacterium]
MLYYLKNLETFWGPFRLCEYQTVRAVMAGLTALFLGFLIAPLLLQRLRKIVQYERSSELMGELAKPSGKVPTMGGIIILVPALISALLWIPLNTYVITALIVYLGMSLVGWLDDYLKVKRKNSDGLSGGAKIVGLLLAAIAGIALLLAMPETRTKAIELWLPFVKTAVLPPDTWPFWLAAAFATFFFCLVTIGSSNAVNLTDGIDGLAIGCVVSTILTFGIVAYLAGHMKFAAYLQISYVPSVGELAVLTAAILGGCLTFLWYNASPAEIYMGDIGALGLGGFIGAIAFMTNHPVLLIIVGGIFVLEAASVILQRSYYKYTKKRSPIGQGIRLFAMSPLHHHFQKRSTNKWADTKIVIRFWILSLLCGIAGLISLKLR